MSELNNDDIIAARNQFDTLRLALKSKHLPVINDEPVIPVDTIERMLPAIDKALPRRPEPTMSNITWKHEDHFLVEAKVNTPHNDSQFIAHTVIMIEKDVDDSYVRCFEFHNDKWYISSYRSFLLTPTGKRYNLNEITGS